MRLVAASSVGPTASDSMLKPRRANRPAQRVSTPGRFCTSTLSVWTVMAASKRGLSPPAGTVPISPRSYALLHPLVLRGGTHGSPTSPLLLHGGASFVGRHTP